MVEAAIVFPLLLMLIFGMIDFGLLLKDHLALAQTAREAARIGAVGGTVDGATITTLAGRFGIPDPSAVVPTEIIVPPDQGGQVAVGLSYDHDMIVFGDAITLHSSMVMRRE